MSFPWKNSILLAAALAAAPLLQACIREPAGAAPSSPKASGAVGSAQVSIEKAPAVEAPLLLPGVARGNEAVLVVFRHSDHRFMDAFGFDTETIRFTSLPGGWLSGAVVSERRMDGERESGRWSFARAGDEILVAKSDTDPATAAEGPAGAIAPNGKGLRVTRGSGVRILSTQGPASFEYASPDGSVAERWNASRGGVSAGSEFLESGSVVAAGSYAFPAKGSIVYREGRKGDGEGTLAVECRIWPEKGGAYRARTEGVEAISEIYVEGLAEALSGDRALENLALIDFVLGEGRNIRPVLALAFGANGGK